MSCFDAIVIGAGPAGASAALHLARAGVKVLLIEKHATAHHKVCGEFLSGAAREHLAALGIDLPKGENIVSGRLVCGDRAVPIRLPRRALSLSRFQLDEALLEQARASGVVVRRGSSVRNLKAGLFGWHVECSDGFHAVAPAAFLATGKHNLRCWPRPSLAASPIAFKMHYRLRTDQMAALAGHVEIYLFEGGYAGLEPVEGGHANLCLVVLKERFRICGKSWQGLLAHLKAASPLLGQRLDQAEPRWQQPLSIYGIPYGYLYKSAQDDGLYRLGDQMAVIPSFTGSGMAIALHTARLAAAHYLKGSSASYHQQARKELSPSVRAATLLTRLPPGQVHLACRIFPGIAETIIHATEVRA